MHLSRLILNPRHRAVRLDLADCQALHRTVMGAFPQIQPGRSVRHDLGVLHRVDVQPRTGYITLLVQSREEPVWSHLPVGYLASIEGANPASKSVDRYYAGLRDGMRLRFRLRANPTRKIDTKSGPNGERRNGKRVELRDEASQLEWLRRKSDQHGFYLGLIRAYPPTPSPLAWNVRPVPANKVTGERPGGDHTPGRKMTFAAVTFDGELTIADAERFRTALEQGIGSAKAYGFGLLSIGLPRG